MCCQISHPIPTMTDTWGCVGINIDRCINMSTYEILSEIINEQNKNLLAVK